MVILVDVHSFCRLQFQRPGSFALQYQLLWYVILKTFLLLYNFPIYLMFMYQCDQCCISKAFKRAAESLEKLMDVTREELPDTMAAVRLSGMEISDLTMELSDLGLAP